MVQLKFFFIPRRFADYKSFNSCMVQLKSALRRPARRQQSRFNSCMVQLKFGVYMECHVNSLVLIPVWCN